MSISPPRHHGKSRSETVNRQSVDELDQKKLDGDGRLDQGRKNESKENHDTIGRHRNRTEETCLSPRHESEHRGERERSRQRRRRDSSSSDRSCSTECRRHRRRYSRSPDHHRHRSYRRSSRDYSADRSSHDDRRYRRRKDDPSPPRERSYSVRRSQEREKPTPQIQMETIESLAKREASPEIPQSERDKRTIFVAQLHAKGRARDIRDFFEKHQAGRVRDVRLIADRGSRRMKGLGYIEFYDYESIEKAVQLNGQLLMGIPIIIQKAEAEKNRAAEAAAAATLPSRPGLTHTSVESYQSHTLFVSNLSPSFTADDVRKIFEKFGQVDNVQLTRDGLHHKSGAYITFQVPSTAKQAAKLMSGFSIGDYVLRCTLTSDSRGAASTELDDVENAGLKLDALSRAELMSKLARTDLSSASAPAAGKSSKLSPSTASPPAPTATSSGAASRCLLLTNMFNPAEETEPNWEREIEAEVKDECDNNYGLVQHIKVISDSIGHVYLKFDTLEASEKAMRSLNGRWFASRQISATYISVKLYHAKFPEATFL